MRRIVHAVITGVLLVVFTSGCIRLAPVTKFREEKKPAPPAATEETPQRKSTPSGVEGYEIYENKDPFQPLVGEGAATTVVPTTTTTPSGTTTTATTATLISISSDGQSATIKIGETTYENIKVGETFGTYYRLLEIGTGSVVILYGDNEYTLYLGETLTLK